MLRKYYKYKIHLKNGSHIVIDGVKELTIKWSGEQLRSYNITFRNPKYNKLFWLDITSIIAIEEIKSYWRFGW